jgi:hypothetical protein
MFEEELYFPGKSHGADEVQIEIKDAADSDSLGSVLSALSSGSPKSMSQPVPLASDSTARPNSPPTPKVTVRRNQEPEPVSSVEGKVNVAPPPVPASPRRDPSPKSLFHPPPLSRPKTAPTTGKRLPTLSISTTVSAPVGEGKANTSVGSHHRQHHQPSISTVKASDSIPSHHHQRRQRATSPTASISASSPFSPTAPISVLNSNSNSNLVRTAPMAPVDPRDHTVLGMIYTEMHVARFINLAPLSLLASDLSTWFKGM